MVWDILSYAYQSIDSEADHGFRVQVVQTIIFQ